MDTETEDALVRLVERQREKIAELKAQLASVVEANQVELDAALKLALPGRVLPLDENSGTNSEGVALLVGAIKTLAKELFRLKAPPGERLEDHPGLSRLHR